MSEELERGLKFISGDPETNKRLVSAILGVASRPAKTLAAYLGHTPEGMLPPGFWGPKADEAWTKDAAMGFAGQVGPKITGNAIRAHHGSPHDFDKFDMSKIGTGEGRQAYGHGLYFAENPKVAESYKFVNQPPYMSPPIQRIAQEAYEKAIKSGAKDPIAVARNELYAAYKAESNPFIRAHVQDAVNNIETLVGRGKIGNMYEVNIHADPNKLLDWDKPLSGQAVGPAILDNPSLRVPSGIRPVSPNVTGGEAYSSLRWAADPALGTSDKVAANALRDAGIPGIKYLDQGSRAPGLQFEVLRTPQGFDLLKNQAGTDKTIGSFATRAEADAARAVELAKLPSPTSNYVMFDDRLIEILRKYGIPAGGIAGAGALASGADPAQAQEPSRLMKALMK